ncbi:type IV secretory system conjugative DNA transfer family protein [Calidifontibacter sp. DB0510]|uniref:Type IV secretory system conjugative DNA transfer family protein n=1 Tax=Metallococcus carri TaxID=1656884 RepID=A0A967B673_9MICO|nr:type IV secretory system conjugative DNA transfer family protein [Metallococcus carri]NHN55406.1 type IV secretory system conjugative DNA transfer family protein [Metallococcus carri]NOP36483.1 type IV secretory system conjugative DNA transfer family protein [Calidifontibacter sp. DB2511S]
MSTPRPSGSLGDELSNLGIGILISAAILAAILRGAGSVAAWITGTTQPAGGIEAGLGVLLNPGDPATALDAPGLGAVAYWITASVLILTAGAAGWWGWRLLRDHGRQVKTDPYRIAGIATRTEVARAGSEKALLHRAGHLRPSLDTPQPTDVGYRIGASRGHGVWASVEDSILLLGPPRSGKGAHIVINAILDAPGAVVTTSTRPDNLAATLRARERRGGPVAVFDPQHLAEGVPAGLRWSPIRGCEDPLTAMIRATGLAAGTGLSAGGVEGGGFWEGKTRTALQALLHAAALDYRPPGELFRWTLDPSAAADAVAILTANPNAAVGWAEGLQAMIDSDPRTRDSIWQGVSLALAALADPRVLDAVSPREGEDFDPEAFLRAKGTLYLLATGAGANNSAALVAAFVEDVVEAARRIAATSPGARLDPPLLLALDEVGNLAPLPSLPTLMAEGGGTGITTMPVLQSLAQAREKWSENAAGAIWDASIVKIILGGASNSKDLHDLTTLIGERDEVTDSTTVGDHGSRTAQRSIRRVPIMPPDAIRTLPFGTALVLLRSAPPIVTRLRTWTQRPDATRLRADRTEVEALLQQRP